MISVGCNSALITLCMAESGVRLSVDWSLSILPEVTSSHKAALSHKSLPSDASRVYHYTFTMNFKINS